MLFGPRSGFSMVGMLITMVCLVVLFAIGMSAMNKAVTGQGSAETGTVRSMEDKLSLYALYQSMVAGAADYDGRFLAPSTLTGGGEYGQRGGRGDRGGGSEDTTAGLFSAMVMLNYTAPAKLISGNEYNGYVEPDEDYDFLVYDPSAGVYWDREFQADLDYLSNTSFAHMPLCGDRFRSSWTSSFRSDFPLLGNRGPKDGIPNPDSWTYGRNGTWGGHLAFGDGHIDFVTSFTLPRLGFERDGQRVADNIYAMEDGPLGADAIISFTRTMTGDGPELQYD